MNATLFTIEEKVYLSKKATSESNTSSPPSSNQDSPLGTTEELIVKDTLYLANAQFPLASFAITLPCLPYLSASLTTVYLEYSFFTTIPPSLFFLSQLSTLSLSHNRLQVVPPEVLCWPRLSTLTLHHNYIHNVSQEVGRCQHLTRLDLSWNQVETLPASLLGLRSLQYIWIDGCPIVKNLMHSQEFQPKNVTRFSSEQVPCLIDIAMNTICLCLLRKSSQWTYIKAHCADLLQELKLIDLNDKAPQESVCDSILMLLPKEVAQSVSFFHEKQIWLTSIRLQTHNLLQTKLQSLYPTQCLGCNRIVFQSVIFKRAPVVLAKKVTLVEFQSCGRFTCNESILRRFNVDDE